MDRNLRLYPVYQAFRSSFFWMPVFFLYFLSVLSLEQALLLEAIYYVAAVSLEVPSGYFSDRIGRKLTLLAATASAAAGAVIFATTASFLPFVLAQVLRAASHAFNSGTDTALLFDSLSDTGRESEIGDHEARAYTAGLLAASGACLVGGLVGGIDLRLVWWLTAAGDLVALLVACGFREPSQERARALPLAALREVLARALQRPLGWIFVFVMGMIVLNHVPYEFFQPYLELLFGAVDAERYGVTPAIAGGLTASMWLLGAGASSRAMAWRARAGVFPGLLGAMLLQIVIVLGMAALLSPWVMLLIACRSVPMALYTPIMNAEVHPRIPTEIRATYFSVQSLVGRLAFSVCLAASSWAVAGQDSSHDVLSRVLLAFAVGGGALWLGLALRSPRADDAASRAG